MADRVRDWFADFVPVVPNSRATRATRATSVDKYRKTWGSEAVAPSPGENNIRATEGNTAAPVAHVAQPLPSKGYTGPVDKAKQNQELTPCVALVAQFANANDRGAQTTVEHGERAAIFAESSGCPAWWAEGFARLDCLAPPPGFSPRGWQQVLDDGRCFLNRWAAEAIRLGWTAEDVFGVHAAAPGARVDGMGLVLLINGGEVISISGGRASIRMPGGSILTYLRQPRSGAVVLWDLPTRLSRQDRGSPRLTRRSERPEPNSDARFEINQRKIKDASRR